ncbi:HAD-IA family hydrolase [Nanoarchaeota archaeon]
MTIKGIICDFGGVIGTDADTILHDILIERGVSEEEFLEIWRLHWPKMKIGEEETDDIWNEVKKRYGDFDIDELKSEYRKGITVDASIIDYFRKVKSKGIKLAVLANEAREWFNLKNEIGKLDEVFDVVYSSADLKVPKPYPESYLKTLKALGLEAEEVVFVDNMERNTKAAEEIGMKSILFVNLEQLKKELIGLGII